jgi:hypothetical protein
MDYSDHNDPYTLAAELMRDEVEREHLIHEAMHPFERVRGLVEAIKTTYDPIHQNLSQVYATAVDAVDQYRPIHQDLRQIYATSVSIMDQYRLTQERFAPVRDELSRAMESLRPMIDQARAFTETVATDGLSSFFEDRFSPPNFGYSPPGDYDGLRKVIRREVREAIEETLGGGGESLGEDEPPLYGNDGVKRKPGF